MKIPINVIDLDNTLIPYDSFDDYVIFKIKSGSLIHLFYSIVRKFRLISKLNYKMKIYNLLLIEKQSIIKKILNKIEVSINNDVINLIDNHSPNDVINVLLSASPDIYVNQLKAVFNWEAFGSGYYDGKFIELYSANKIKFLNKYYPDEKYFYNFAISDSTSDINLMKLFKTYRIYK